MIYIKNRKRLNKSLEQISGVQGVVITYDGKQGIKELSDIHGGLKEQNILISLLSDVPLLPEDSASHSSKILAYNTPQSGILNFFQALEEQALYNGSAFAAIPPHPLVLKILPDWAKTLEDRSIKIVPLSVLMDYRL